MFVCMHIYIYIKSIYKVNQKVIYFADNVCVCIKFGLILGEYWLHRME